MGEQSDIPSDIASQAIQRSRALIKSDPQLASMMPDMDLFNQLHDSSMPCERMIDEILSAYSGRACLGVRSYDLTEGDVPGQTRRDYAPSFSVKTYGQIRGEIRAIANAWKHVPSVSVNPDEFVAILGFASSDYFSLDCASVYAHAVSVPLQSASSGADLSDIFERIEPKCLAASYEDLPTAIDLAAHHPSLRSLVVFDVDMKVVEEREALAAARQTLADKDVNILTLCELIALGKEHIFTFLPDHPEGHDRLALIIHSSGSTGVPKGAMITAGTVKQYWMGYPEKFPTISVIFSPLNHVLGRATLLQTLGKGSTAYFTLAPDMSTLFEDIRIARPTSLTFFPRVLDMIYQHYQNEVVKQIAAGKSPEAAKENVTQDMRDTFLGDRLTTATVGSAPTSQAVKDFMAECFGVLMIDGYGSTEAGAGTVTINGVVNRKVILDYKLRDVPELGYYLTDKPYPRGEFCFKGKNQIKGFYKDPNATKDLLTDDGYIITGDIVELHENELIVLVDRRKDVVKLSQGEYVAVGPLGAVFEGSPFIKQIYIYGNSHRAYLVAVVVPDIDAITHTLSHTPEDLEIRSAVRQAILDIAKSKTLKSFEAPRDFIIEPELFSQDNGLLSSVRKKLRPALKRKYSEALEDLYTRHEDNRDAELAALKKKDSGLSPAETLQRVLIIHLGLEDGTAIATDKNFGELGGDSLGAVNFSLMIEDVFDIIFPADKILDSTGNIKSWARDIGTLKASGGNVASFASIHGARRQTVEAKDLTLEAFLSPDLLSNAASLPDAPETPATVLLTGATGFLGRHVCLKWLSELPGTGRLICLVRAENDDAAKRRLNAVFENTAPEMQAEFQRLSNNRIDVIAADISMPNLGLSQDKFDALSQDVDRICHVGALVNHRLSYEHLFSPNVAGTAEIIKLALTHTRKPIDFVSTVSVLPLLDRADENKESAQPMDILRLSDAYASGYATSKWAAEILLREAAKAHAMPVNIIRGNMMLAHRDLAGAINPSDMFTRLLFSVIATGLAPKSFFGSAPANYDGLPVDLIANCVVNMRLSTGQDNLCVMNACNYTAGSEFSLDAIVNQIRDMGHKIDAIEDYSDWFERFSTRLHSLPDAEKQRSAIDLLPAFERPQSSHVQFSFDTFKSLITTLDGSLPKLNGSYVAKILADMKTIGILE